MADVGDPAAALLVNDGLVGAAALQIVVADELHVALLGFVLRHGLADERDAERRKAGDVLRATIRHDPLLQWFSRRLIHLFREEWPALRLRAGAVLRADLAGT